MNNARQAKSKFYIWLGILGVLIVAALVAWIYELWYGLAVTGMRDVISWGLYILTFTFFVKLSAGGLIVASSAEVFHIHDFKPITRLGVLTAVACIVAAAASIIPDLGHPERILNLLLHPNFHSPMMWDITIIAIYFVISLLDLKFLTGKQTSQSTRILKVLAFIGLPAAFALHSITAWIFGLQISRPFWNSAIMAPLFVVSAILSGSALMILVMRILEKFFLLQVGEKTWQKLRVVLTISLILDLYFVFSEYMTILWGQVPSENKALQAILPGGPYQLLFWLEWLVGGLIPFLLLVWPRMRRSTSLAALASILILVGVYAYQIQLVVVGMANPLIQLPPGISLGTFTSGMDVFQLTGQYSPTWVEYLIILGLFAFIAGVISLGYYFLFREKTVEKPEKTNSLVANDQAMKGASL